MCYAVGSQILLRLKIHLHTRIFMWRLENRGILFKLPVRVKDISLLQSVQTNSEDHPPPFCAKINGPFFLGLRRTELEADHSFPSIGQVKKSELKFLWRVQVLYLVRMYLWFFAENEWTLDRKYVWYEWLRVKVGAGGTGFCLRGSLLYLVSSSKVNGLSQCHNYCVPASTLA